jgi:tripartite-type tricarboxylate transporter receptor subunit TctC
VLREALTSPDVIARTAADGAEPQRSTPEEYTRDIEREEAKWSKVVREAGAKAE